MTSVPYDDGEHGPAPSFSTFERDYHDGKAQLVYRRAPGDLDTPVSAYLKLAGNGQDTFLLESVEGGEQLGRYSFAGLQPDLVWRAHGNVAEINEAPGIDPDGFRTDDLGTLASLTRLLENSRIDVPKELAHRLPPMAAGVFGYFGYDFVRLTEALPNKPSDPLGLPDGYFVRPTILAIFDNVRREVVLVTPVRPQDGVSARDAYALAAERLSDAFSDLAQSVPTVEADTFDVPQFGSNMAPGQYEDMVEKAKSFIRAGDIFQVVLPQRYTAKAPTDPFTAYRQLRRINPSPFLFYLNFRPATLMGASPEILVRVRNGEVTIRPIAGTRKRGLTKEEDEALERELLADPKERAEHLMLLDLGRNDVGRSAEIGTVVPTESFIVERFSHVMHITSNVTGRLRSSVTPLEALANGFPAGTLTGAPKIRAMEIIDTLEPVSRGPYGGCIGYFGADGGVDTCIGLRMAIFKDGRVHIQAGAGVVADSDPAAEDAECRAKAGALIDAVAAASRQRGN